VSDVSFFVSMSLKLKRDCPIAWLNLHAMYFRTKVLIWLLQVQLIVVGEILPTTVLYLSCTRNCHSSPIVSFLLKVAILHHVVLQ
jgi:hypothetical protein